MRRLALALALSSVGLLILSSTCAWGADIESCTDITNYFAKPLPPGELYARIQALGSAISVLKAPNDTPSDACPLWLIEHTYWEYADSLHQFSRSFKPGDSQDRWYQTTQAAYRDYLSWFMSLTEKQKDQLIAGDTHISAADPDFDNVRRGWLRRRIGNVIGGLGITYEETHRLSDLVSVYQELAEQDPDAYAKVFPEEIVSNWFKYLRTMPEFKASKGPSEIQAAISDPHEPQVAESWEAFRRFLNTYVRMNPSIRDQWGPWLGRLNKWLNA